MLVVDCGSLAKAKILDNGAVSIVRQDRPSTQVITDAPFLLRVAKDIIYHISTVWNASECRYSWIIEPLKSSLKKQGHQIMEESLRTKVIVSSDEIRHRR